MDSASARHTEIKDSELSLQFALHVWPEQPHLQSPFLRNRSELRPYTCTVKVLLSYDNKGTTTTQALPLLFYISISTTSLSSLEQHWGNSFHKYRARHDLAHVHTHVTQYSNSTYIILTWAWCEWLCTSILPSISQPALQSYMYVISFYTSPCLCGCIVCYIMWRNHQSCIQKSHNNSRQWRQKNLITIFHPLYSPLIPFLTSISFCIGLLFSLQPRLDRNKKCGFLTDIWDRVLTVCPFCLLGFCILNSVCLNPSDPPDPQIPCGPILGWL